MKYGIENLLTIDNVTFYSDATPVRGGEEINMLDRDTRHTCMFDEGTVTVRLEFPSMVVDFIALVNVGFGDTLTINTYTTYPGAPSNTKAYSLADLCGLDNKYAYLSLTNKAAITAIELVFTGEDYESIIDTFIGYIWAGLMVDLGCAEKIQPIDQSVDEVKITRVNYPDINDRFEYQQYNITLKKENDFETLRDNMRNILTTGYGNPRVWLIDEPFLTVGEVLWGILDSGKIGYDLIKTGDGGFIAQTTIGIREVF